MFDNNSAPTISKKVMVIGVLALIGFMVLAGFAIQSMQGPKTTDIQAATTDSSQMSADEAASDAVSRIKKANSFPYKISDTITLNDIVAMGNTIKYVYTLKEPDASKFDNITNKTNVAKSACNEKSIAALQNGIRFEYSYTNTATGAQKTVLITNQDCT